MQVRKVKKIKKTSFIEQGKLFIKQVFQNFSKKKVAGASLPDNKENHQKHIRLFVAIITSSTLLVILVIFANAWRLSFYEMNKPGFNYFTQTIDSNKIFHQALDIRKNPLPIKWLTPIVAISLLGGFGLSKRLKFATKDVAYGQKGDERFTTEKELEKQYPMIPDHDDRGDN